jgi:hypothetical protein
MSNWNERHADCKAALRRPRIASTVIALIAILLALLMLLAIISQAHAATDTPPVPRRRVCPAGQVARWVSFGHGLTFACLKVKNG